MYKRIIFVLAVCLVLTACTRSASNSGTLPEATSVLPAAQTLQAQELEVRGTEVFSTQAPTGTPVQPTATVASGYTAPATSVTDVSVTKVVPSRTPAPTAQPTSTPAPVATSPFTVTTDMVAGVSGVVLWNPIYSKAPADLAWTIEIGKDKGLTDLWSHPQIVEGTHPNADECVDVMEHVRVQVRCGKTWEVTMRMVSFGFWLNQQFEVGFSTLKKLYEEWEVGQLIRGIAWWVLGDGRIVVSYDFEDGKPSQVCDTSMAAVTNAAGVRIANPGVEEVYLLKTHLHFVPADPTGKLPEVFAQGSWGTKNGGELLPPNCRPDPERLKAYYEAHGVTEQMLPDPGLATGPDFQQGLVSAPAVIAEPLKPWKAGNGETCYAVPHVLEGESPDASPVTYFSHCVNFGVVAGAPGNPTVYTLKGVFTRGNLPTEAGGGTLDTFLAAAAQGNPSGKSGEGIMLGGPSLNDATWVLVKYYYHDGTTSECSTVGGVYNTIGFYAEVPFEIRVHNAGSVAAVYDLWPWGGDTTFGERPSCMPDATLSLATAANAYLKASQP